LIPGPLLAVLTLGRYFAGERRDGDGDVLQILRTAGGSHHDLRYFTVRRSRLFGRGSGGRGVRGQDRGYRIGKP
jgi:hypothetical protein